VSLTVALVRASVVATAHEVRDHCWGRRGLALTSLALAACLAVTDTAPPSAVAAPVETVAPGPVNQDYRVRGTGPDTWARADFTVVGRTAGGAVLTRPSGSGEAVARPVAGTVPSAGNFGGRNVPGCAACSTSHQGTDFAAATGTPVFAVMSGTVESAGALGGYGNQVLLRHPDGTQTRYGHLSVIGVRPGQSVDVGERIGAVGSTGVSTGPHLHFEVVLGGRPVDPEPWLAARGLLH
jgi:murein DD-endopeptidase MepM/ murein hydrolase activator NlpD